MPPAKLRGSRLRARPFVATVLLLTLLTACSFYVQTQRHDELPHGGHDAPASLFRRSRGKDEECSNVHSAKDQCAFVRQYCHDDDAGMLPYLEWYYCAFDHVKPFAFMLLVMWLGLLFTTIGIAASDFFSINLSTIATILGLSESLAGVTFLAFGNGSPDVFSTFAAMSSNSPSMAVGELIGAACFITGVVAGSMALVREFRVDRKTYVRDICFFIVAVAFSMAFLADGQLRFWECWAMVGYYVLYVATVVTWHWYSRRRKRLLRREGEARSHFYSIAGLDSDELDGEPYRDEPDEAQNDVRDGSVPSGTSRRSVSTTERGSVGGLDSRGPDSGDEESIAEGSDGDHERMVAAEVSRSMRVLRTGRSGPNKMNIRPSLVGALEFRSALAQLQRESNLQLSPITGRSYSHHHLPAHARRGTTSVMPDAGLWDSVSTPVVASRDRAFSYAGRALSPAAPPKSPPNEEAQGASHTSVKAQPVIPTAPYTVGGSLAPPPRAPAVAADDGKGRDSSTAGDKPPSPLQLIIPSRRSSVSDSSPSTPFPRYLESPSPMSMTPRQHPERIEFVLPPPRTHDSYFPEMHSPVVELQRPLRWWPYSILPPPHVVLATLFPTLQGWREKTIWDKFLSTVSVPSIFLLVITLPVVESETTEGSLDDMTILDEARGRDMGHSAPPLAVEGQQIEPENEWERFRRRSRWASRSIFGPPSPRLIVTLNNEDTMVSPESGPGNGAGAIVVKPLSDMPSVSNANDETPTWNRWLVCLQLFTGPLFAAFILWANMRDDFSDPGTTLVKMILYTLVVSVVLLVLLFVFTSDAQRPKYHFLLCFLGFIISIAWISTIAGEVVGVLKTFGVILNISEALLGLTIFAAGNSVGDLVADITVARLGYPVMALSACFGGPMLNILLGIGIGGVLMMVQSANKKHAKHPNRPIRYGPYRVDVGSTLLISSVTLLVMLILLLIIVPMNKWILSRKIGWGLIIIWTLSTIANVVVEVLGVWQES